MTTPDSRGLSDIPRQTLDAASALASLQAPAEQAAQAIDEAFTRAGASLVRSLARAASDGKLSLADLAQSLLAALSAGSSKGGFGEAIRQAIGPPLSGQRADGGPVVAGGTYLVGERGPELFRPVTGGTVIAPGNGINVTVNLAGTSPETLVRSEAQIAQALVRAVRLGLPSV